MNVFILLLGIGIPVMLSLYRYHSYETDGEKIEVLLLQPELDPYTEKYEKSSTQIVSGMTRIIREYSTPDTQLIIGPETSYPGKGSLIKDDLQNNRYTQSLQAAIPTPTTSLITGIDTYEIVPSDGIDINYNAQTQQFYKRYNAVIDITPNQPLQFYYKSKMVPFVEHFPYPTIFKPLTSSMIDFGGEVSTMARPHTPTVFTTPYNAYRIAPMICYESVYGEYTAMFVKKGANLITISTNDSWWDNSQGHKQFLAYARLRAIENRRYIARSANSGISAFINAKGDIESSLPYLYEGGLLGTVVLLPKMTIYTQNGDYIATIALLILGILLGIWFSKPILKLIKKRVVK